MQIAEPRRQIAYEIRAKTAIQSADDFQAIAEFLGLPLKRGDELDLLKKILRRVTCLSDLETAWQDALRILLEKRLRDEQQAKQIAERQKAEAQAKRRRKPCPKCGRKTPLDLCLKCKQEEGKVPCIACGEKTRFIHEILKAAVCDKCRKNNERFKLITKSRAKDEFGLTDSELSVLQTIEAQNPHYRSASPMILVLRQEVCDLRNALEQEEPDRFFDRRLKKLARDLDY